MLILLSVLVILAWVATAMELREKSTTPSIFYIIGIVPVYWAATVIDVIKEKLEARRSL